MRDFDEIVRLRRFYEPNFATTLLDDWLKERGYNLDYCLVGYKASNPEEDRKIDLTIMDLKQYKYLDLIINLDIYTDDKNFITIDKQGDLNTMGKEIIRTTVKDTLITNYTSRNWNYLTGKSQEILYYDTTDGPLELSVYWKAMEDIDTVAIEIWDFNKNTQLGLLRLEYSTSKVIKFEIYDILLKKELIIEYDYED